MLEDIITGLMVCTYTVVGFAGSVPQIVKTFRTKSVKDMSLASWVLWVASSVSYLLYACIVNPTFALVFTSLLDVFFNVVILVQILYYGRRREK